VTNTTANKGVVVERLSHYYNIPLQQIATLGDQQNDVLMFERSGMSIAMGNATDDVQRQATFVTATNNDEGFAKAVEQFILPRSVAAPAVPPANNPGGDLDSGAMRASKAAAASTPPARPNAAG